MKRRSLSELRERLARGKSLPRGVLFELERDDRAGAQALVKAVKAKQAANRAEGQRLRNMLRYEGELYAQGLSLIAGVDEAGMAPLAGPVTAAACILPKGYKLKGLDDSKKILDEEKREELAAQVKADAVCFAVGWASVEEIDSINIYHAGLLAMRRAVEGLTVKPEFCLVDARKIPVIETPQKGIIHGDALSLSIAAASVIAKTTRDRFMNELDQRHPGYGFASHKGYPTPEHQDALERLGALLIHRRSFAPVRRALGLEPTQDELFAIESVKSRPQKTRRAKA
ncbi:MAG: ribonuclease HII [Archangiaceae bacterium]|nr:ribonuclease HII [Archangiaceae bacterium]